jgi:Lysozyme like domain
MPTPTSDVDIARAAIGAGFNATPITSRTPAVIMTAIAIMESSGRYWIVNPKHKSGTYGLWQISKSDHPDLWNENWQDPNVNAKMAMGVFKKQGYGAWSVYGKGFGVYRAALPRAIKAVNEATIDNAPAPDIPLPGPIDDAKKMFEDLQRIVDFAGDQRNWMRLGLFVVGGVLLIVGIFRITGDNKLSEGTKTIIKTVATKGLKR